jgi:hypothetical protein
MHLSSFSSTAQIFCFLRQEHAAALLELPHLTPSATTSSPRSHFLHVQPLSRGARRRPFSGSPHLPCAGSPSCRSAVPTPLRLPTGWLGGLRYRQPRHGALAASPGPHGSTSGMAVSLFPPTSSLSRNGKNFVFLVVGPRLKIWSYAKMEVRYA